MAQVWQSNGNRVLGSIKPGDEVTILDKSNPSFYLVALADGTTGYVPVYSVSLDHTVPGVPAESIQARQVRDQLFRIYRTEKDTNDMSVRVWARHVYYDLLGVVALSGECENLTVAQAMTRLTSNCNPPNPGFNFYTDDTEARITADYSRKGVIEGHLDPDEGILAQSGLRMVRDNYDVFLTPASTQVRMPITYASNLIGVSLEINEDGIINRIIPVGQNKDGDPVVGAAVDSPNNHAGTMIRARAIEYHEAREKDAVGDEPAMTLAQVKSKLAELAAEDFEKGIDYPDVSLKVDFLQLGDTEEYQQYKEMDRLYMGDIIRIVDEVNGLDVEAEITEYEWDCLLGRYKTIGVGVTNAHRTIGSVGVFMLPDGSIGRHKIAMGGIDASRLDALSVTSAKIQLAAIQAAHIEHAAIKTAHIEDASIIQAKIADAAVGTAQIEEASIVSAHIQDGVIEDAHIGTAGIDFARIRDLAAGTAVITEGIGGKLIIDRLAVSDANIVNLTAGQLIVQGASGALYQLTVNEDGDVITELRQIGNNDIADVSLNAGEKLIKSSITADLLNVQEIFASEAMIAAIKAHNIESHSIGVDQLVPGVFEDAIFNATGQQLVVEFSHGTILDRQNTQTIARVKVYHLGVDITERMPDTAITWERMSEDKAGDAVWNAIEEHQNTKAVVINAADVDFRGVLRCQINEARLYSVPGIEDDGILTMTDYGSGDAGNYLIINGELIYTGENVYEVRNGEIFSDMLIGAFRLDTQLSNLKTSYLDISRHGIELYADGYLSLIAGSKFNMRAGSGVKAIGLSNDHYGEYFAWAGHDNPALAPYYVKMDGEVRATKLRLNNSNITEFTQHYAYDDSDNASPGFPMLFDIFIPSDYSGIQSMKLTFKVEPFRAYSTGAASGGGATSSSGGGGARTSRSGGGGTSSTSPENYTAETLLYTDTDGGGNTGASSATNTGNTTPPSSNLIHNHTMAHTHNRGNHSHSVGYHNHSYGGHNHQVYSHTHIVDIPGHTHTVPDHTHAIVYGIYQGSTATGVQVHVDGTYIGNFVSLSAQDVTAHLSKSGGKILRDRWHTVTLTPNALTRIRAQVFIIGVVAQAANAIY